MSCLWAQRGWGWLCVCAFWALWQEKAVCHKPAAPFPSVLTPQAAAQITNSSAHTHLYVLLHSLHAHTHTRHPKDMTVERCCNGSPSVCTVRAAGGYMEPLAWHIKKTIQWRLILFPLQFNIKCIFCFWVLIILGLGSLACREKQV